MNQLIYIFVEGRGFVMSFDHSGPRLQFTLYPSLAQDFDTEQQAKHIIKVNQLVPGECTFMTFTK